MTRLWFVWSPAVRELPGTMKSLRRGNQRSRLIIELPSTLTLRYFYWLLFAVYVRNFFVPFHFSVSFRCITLRTAVEFVTFCAVLITKLRFPPFCFVLVSCIHTYVYTNLYSYGYNWKKLNPGRKLVCKCIFIAIRIISTIKNNVVIHYIDKP